MNLEFTDQQRILFSHSFFSFCCGGQAAFNMSEMETDLGEEKKEGGSGMDMDVEPATRTLREVNQDLKRVELKIQEVEHAQIELLTEAAEDHKTGKTTFMLDERLALLKGKLQGLQDDKKAFLRQQELLMQQPTAPSSGKTPTDTHTHHSLYTPPLS